MYTDAPAGYTWMDQRSSGRTGEACPGGPSANPYAYVYIRISIRIYTYIYLYKYEYIGIYMYTDDI